MSRILALIWLIFFGTVLFGIITIAIGFITLLKILCFVCFILGVSFITIEACVKLINGD